MKNAVTPGVAALDRAADKRRDVSFLEQQLDQAETLFVPFLRGQPFVRGSELALLTRRETGDLIDQATEMVWLGLLAGRACFALDLGPGAERHAALSGSQPSDLRMQLAQLPSAQLELALYGRALFLWHARHSFCSVCGQPSRPRQGGHTRVCSSSSCASEHFPRTDPCVLVLVCDGPDRCLIARSQGWPAGMYSALAGFVEPGETLEQAVAREVLEEVGVEVGAMRYVMSQPWPFPASLMLGYIADARTLELRVDSHELEAARWVTREQLRDPQQHGFFVPRPAALAGQLLAAFVAGTLLPPSA
jgi:NAD+ diphosphatase